MPPKKLLIFYPPANDAQCLSEQRLTNLNIDFDSKGQRAEISQQTNPYRLRRLLEYLIVNHDRGPSPLTHQRAALGRRKFYGRWFLAAAKAQALWKQALKNPNFQKQVDRLSVLALPDFGIGATVLFSRLETNFASIIVSLNEEDETLVEEFAMMAAMGFFVLTGERYQMAFHLD